MAFSQCSGPLVINLTALFAMMLSLQQSVITRMHAWLEKRFPPDHLVSPCFFFANVEKNRWKWKFAGLRATLPRMCFWREWSHRLCSQCLEVTGNRRFVQVGHRDNGGHVALVAQEHPWGLACFRAGLESGQSMHICSSLSF